MKKKLLLASFMLATSAAYSQQGSFLSLADNYIEGERALRIVETSSSGKFAVVEAEFNLTNVDPLAELAPEDGIVREYFLVSKGLNTVRQLVKKSYQANRVKLPVGSGTGEGQGVKLREFFIESTVSLNADAYRFELDANGREIVTNSTLVTLNSRRRDVKIPSSDRLRTAEYKHPNTTMCTVHHFEVLSRPDLGDLTREAQRRIATENNLFWQLGSNQDVGRIYDIRDPRLDVVEGKNVPASAECREYSNGAPVVFQAGPEHVELFPAARGSLQRVSSGDVYYSGALGRDLKRGHNVLIADWDLDFSEITFSALRRTGLVGPMPVIDLRIAEALEAGLVTKVPAYVLRVQQGEKVLRVRKNTSRLGGVTNAFYEVQTIETSIIFNW